MVKCSKKSFSLSDLWVSTNDRVNDFYLSSWQRGESAIPMFLVRLVLTTGSVGTLIFSLHMVGDKFWLIYLTHWGLLLVALLNLSGLMVSCLAICKKIPDSTELPWYISTYWIFFNIGVPIAIVITALYWILLYNIETEVNFMLDLSTHGFNSCIVFIELVLSRTPLRLLHVYQPLGLGLWYAAFSGIYYAAGGTNNKGDPYIYDILDWRNPGPSAAMTAAAIASLIIIHFVLSGICFCRDKISLSLIRTTSLNLPLTPPDRHMPTGVV